MQDVAAQEGHDGLRGEARQQVHGEPAAQVDGAHGVAVRHPRAVLPALRAGLGLGLVLS